MLICQVSSQVLPEEVTNGRNKPIEKSARAPNKARSTHEIQIDT